MKAPAHFLTASVVIVLLASAGVCLGLRHAADRRRVPVAGVGPDSTGFTVDHHRVRVSEDRDALFSSRPASREEMRERLVKLRACATDLDRTHGLLQTLDALRPEDFPVFCEVMDATEGGDNRLRAVVISAWAEVDPAAALEHEFKRSGGDPYDCQSTMVLQIWAERHPMAALDWLAAHNHGGNPVDEVLKKLAQDDPAAALSWAMAHDEAERVKGMPHSRISAALRGMMTGHLDEAMRSFASLPEELRHRLLFPVCAEAAKNLDEAGRRRWLESLPESEDRNAAAAALISGMGSPVSVTKRLELLAEYPDAIAQPGMADLFRQWAGKDSASAIAALDRVPEGDRHDEALREIIRGMVQEGDAKGALSLMNLHPEKMDAITLTLWFGMAASNAHEWPLAISQLPRMTDASYREQAYLEIMNSWLFTNRAGAREWLDSHDDVPENVRKALELR